MALNGQETIFSAVLSMESLVGHMNKSPNHMKHLYFHCFHDIIAMFRKILKIKI